jgi:predicted ABC-type transport system involved in lysophospholipase L1 biosynthesis ATPase subunit
VSSVVGGLSRDLSGLREPAIELRGVSRIYPSGAERVSALCDVDLVIYPGEAVAITGPSGSGKTTLLNLVAGLDHPTSGEIRVIGQSLGELSEGKLTAFRAKSIGLVFQDPHLLPGLSAVENVAVARLPWGRRSQLMQEAKKLLEALGLGQRLHHPPSRLSAGERQRVGLARALLGQPAILLADEPTGNLDAKTTEGLIALLTELRDDMQITFVIATHDPAVAAMAQRIVRLVGGTIESDRSIPQLSPVDIQSLQ